MYVLLYRLLGAKQATIQRHGTQENCVLQAHSG